MKRKIEHYYLHMRKTVVLNNLKVIYFFINVVFLTSINSIFASTYVCFYNNYILLLLLLLLLLYYYNILFNICQ